MEATDLESKRQHAKQFLDGVKDCLSTNIEPSAVTAWLAECPNLYPQKRFLEYESLFLDKFVLSPLHEHLQKTQGFSEEEARQAFLAESQDAKQRKRIASDTPASVDKHLFGKAFGSLESTVKSWWRTQSLDRKGAKVKPAVAQSCPDFAFRSPCPFGVVFEAKLFRSGSLEAAKRELVRGIYQCAFYRGLPKVISSKNRTWDYDYACLLIYDASGNNSVKSAWESAVVNQSCWETGNIYVMILP